MNTQNDSGLDSVTVRRAKVDSLSLYEVTEPELQDLERGGPATLYLNFAIFLLSTAISFLIAVLSTEIQSTRTFCVFVIVTVAGFIGGGILIMIWNRSRQTTREIIKRIKARMPGDNTVDLDAQQEDAVDKK